MPSILQVEQIKGPTSGASANTIEIPSGQTLDVNGTLTGDGSNLTGISIPNTGASMFRAIMSGDQSASNNTNVKIAFDTEDYDLDSTYDISNYRWTPTTTGYYQVNLWIWRRGTAGRRYYLSTQLFKNGSQIRDNILAITFPSSNNEQVNSVSTVVYMNGTTDYLEAYHYHYDYDATASMDIRYEGKRTMFEGYLVREA